MTTIDLSSLPKPAVVESLDYETELQDKKDALQEQYPDWDADTESDPSVKLLEVSAYSSVNERQRVNDAAIALMLPWASGDDLDNFAAGFNKTRNTIIEATEDTAAVMESDADFKTRLLLAWSELTCAGTKSSYKAHAKNASSDVKDAVGISDGDGNVSVYILSYDGNGTASAELIQTVQDYFDDEDVYQLCSIITVKSATVTEYSLDITLDVSNSALADTLLSSAETAAQIYVDSVHYLDTKVSISALYAATHLEGIDDVDLGAFTNITPEEYGAAYCTGITISLS